MFASLIFSTLLITQAQKDPFLVETLDGSIHNGILLGATAGELRIKTSEGENAVPISTVRTITREADATGEIKANTWVALTDTTVLAVKQFRTVGDIAQLQLLSGTPLQFSIESILSVHFQDLDLKERSTWLSESNATKQSDFIEIKRDESSRKLAGIVGDIDDASVTFFLDNDPIPVPRDRVKAVYYNHTNDKGTAQVVVQDQIGNRWSAVDFQFMGTLVKFEAGSVDVSLSLSDISLLDFGAGRIQYLSDLEPTIVQHIPFFDEPWQMYKDQDPAGDQLQFQDVSFSKGLLLHSRTLVEYEIPKGASRFESVIGLHPKYGQFGNTIVRIKLDDETQLEETFSASLPPRSISIPIKDQRLLQIEVDYGKFLDLGDWVIFGNARIVR